MKKCIVCGREESDELSIYTTKLPHGEIHLCPFNKCKKVLNLELNDASPIAWVSSGFAEDFRSTLEVAVKQWRENNELNMVNNTPEDELPLLIGNLKYGKSKYALEKRMKK